MEEGCAVLDDARGDSTLKERGRCETDGGDPLTSQNILGERQDEFRNDDVLCCHHVTQCTDTNSDSREQTTSPSHALPDRDVSNSVGSDEQEAMDIDTLQLPLAVEGSSGTDPALQLPLATSVEKPNDINLEDNTELSQKELDDLFAEF